MTKKIISILLSMLMVMSVCAAALAENTDGSGDVQTQDGAAVESDDTSQTDASAEDAAESGETDNGIGRQLQAITKDMLSAASDRYFEYRESVAGSAAGTDDIIIQGEDFVDYASTDVQVYANGDFEYTGEKSAAAYTGESSMAVWSFDVASSGLYNIKVAYTTESSKERTAERAVYIDGCIPFTDFSSVSFERVWTDIFQEEDQGYGENRFEIDSIGSEIRPSSTIVDGMIVKTLSSGDGTDIEIYLEAGNHSIIFESLKETLVIDYIEICHDDDLPSYSDYISGCESKGDSYYNGESIKIEAEQMTTKSIFSIYASSDRTNSSVSPASSGGTTLNIIGTSAWSSNGEWVEWTVDAPSDGLYTVAVKYRQSSSEGLYVSRKVYINGEVPFKEAQAVRFEYADSWTLKRLGDANGNVYYFHLNKGENTIRLEVTQGDMFNVTEELTDALNEINSIYRSIMSITGSSPDKYRDYDFDVYIPEVIEHMAVVANNLTNIRAEIVEKCGNEKAEVLSYIDKLVNQLYKMNKDPNKIPYQFKMFKSNSGSLGDSINSMTTQSLSVDYLVVAGGEEKLKASSNFFKDVAFQTMLFINSFILDYSSPDSMNVDDSSSDEGLTVWISSGRDQAQIIRNTVRNDTSLDINVTVKLVVATSLLPSILSGVGPDVYLGIANNDPVNYAVRGAVEDLTQFEDYEEIAQRFTESAITPFTYEGGVYALPQQQVFSMMFYRTDVFNELQIEVPKTWDDLLYTVTLLSRNNLQVGLSPSMSHYLTLLYQNGEELYCKDENGSYTTINFGSDAAISAFETFCSFYTEYDMPIDFSFANRFRSGEMPIAIVDYIEYNQLTVFAPEIKGLWEMVPIPGNYVKDANGDIVYDENGEPKINNVCVSTSSGNIIVSGLSEEKKQMAWTFIKWWTDTGAQSTFCTEMESLLGAAAKQPTANKQALESLAWTSSEIESLTAQREMTQGTPVIPGNYMVNRQWKFAYDTVYNSSGSPTEELEDTIVTINEELAKKRKEFASIQKANSK